VILSSTELVRWSVGRSVSQLTEIKNAYDKIIRSVGIVRSRTKGHGVCLFLYMIK
jgi:hypothetical protein